MLNKMGDKFKKQGWGWLWAEGTAHTELEQSLDVGGFGYPAMTVVSSKKMKYSSLTGSFGHDGIHEFLRDLSYGKGRTNPVRGAKLPTLKAIDPWDGKDAEMPIEEDIDLSDVDLDKDELWTRQNWAKTLCALDIILWTCLVESIQSASRFESFCFWEVFYFDFSTSCLFSWYRCDHLSKSCMNSLFLLCVVWTIPSQFILYCVSGKNGKIAIRSKNKVLTSYALFFGQKCS